MLIQEREHQRQGRPTGITYQWSSLVEVGEGLVLISPSGKLLCLRNAKIIGVEVHDGQ